ncbi:CRISPR system Cascade subunit CasD [Raineyella antarctica]|uniref:CRISPR system Cascade subunit CasD n=1 Tax=Raineyella antarctica TaxID=1577474 RepID=A0A1G6H6B2_9ACTN|nr:CRISPR system Cascade subunit CasD [Raineyella antarctica]
MLRDFHTAHNPKRPQANIPLSNRFYLSDAVFTAYLGGPSALVEGLASAIVDPAFPLALGRRSCVPVPPLLLTISEKEPREMLLDTPLQAGRSQRRSRARTVRCSVQADVQVLPEEASRRRIRDVPLSFNPEDRRYAYREVVETVVDVANPDGRASGGHDPFAALEGLL